MFAESYQEDYAAANQRIASMQTRGQLLIRQFFGQRKVDFEPFFSSTIPVPGESSRAMEVTSQRWVDKVVSYRNALDEKSLCRERRLLEVKSLQQKEYVMRAVCVEYGVPIPEHVKVLRIMDLRNLCEAISKRNYLDWAELRRGLRLKSQVWHKAMELIRRYAICTRNNKSAAGSTGDELPKNQEQLCAPVDSSESDEGEADPSRWTSMRRRTEDDQKGSGSASSESCGRSEGTEADETYASLDEGSVLIFSEGYLKGRDAVEMKIESIGSHGYVLVGADGQTHMREAVMYGLVKKGLVSLKPDVEVVDDNSKMPSENESATELTSLAIVIAHQNDRVEMREAKIHSLRAEGWRCYLCALCEAMYWCGVWNAIPQFQRFEGFFGSFDESYPTDAEAGEIMMQRIVSFGVTSGVIEERVWGSSDLFLEQMIRNPDERLPDLSSAEKQLIVTVVEKEMICSCSNYVNSDYGASWEELRSCIWLSTTDHFQLKTRDATLDLQVAIDRYFSALFEKKMFGHVRCSNDVVDLDGSDDETQPVVVKSKLCEACGANPIGRRAKRLKTPRFLMIGFQDSNEREGTVNIRRRCVIPSVLEIRGESFTLVARCYCTNPTGVHFWVEVAVKVNPFYRGVYAFDGQKPAAEMVGHIEEASKRLSSSKTRTPTAWLLYEKIVGRV
eukprot:c19769_g1_i3.p1 GENE.c19769_g1_i3~~c19769_g1_i3.p1  ORF type:complete len:673 (+),score=108.33 c19769_g1_i3:681-2699(+)